MLYISIWDCVTSRYHCNFGPEDKSDVVPEDMQALLKSTQKRRINKKQTKQKKGKKVIPEYDAFPVNKSIAAKVKRVGKTVGGFSIKRGCMRCFVAKQLYLDPTLCMLVYENTMHLNARGEHCHGSMVSGFRYALGAGISDEMKYKIAKMHAFGLSPTQIMQQHTKEVRELALVNGTVTRDTFLLPTDIRNICRRRAEELWMKHPSDPISVRMWTLENPDSVFYYQEHSLMDLNSSTQTDAPFTLGIQTAWQLEMMGKFGHNSALSIDATFGTTQTRVPHYPLRPSPLIHIIHCLCVSTYVMHCHSYS